MVTLRILFFLLCLLLSISINAKSLLNRVSTMYQNKDYSELVDTINERISGNRKTRAKLYFYLGTSFSRLGLYDQAAKNLEEAIQLGCRQHEIYYELGFALYSINELERSEKAFIRSEKSNYKPMISLYYMGYIAIIL